MATPVVFSFFSNDHNIPIRTAQPSDVAGFLSKQRQRYRRQHGHFPPDDTQWRCERTPGIHRLLALAQGHWPPTSDVDRRVAWFRRRVLKEKIDSESVAQVSNAAAKHFLAFLNRIALPPERVTQEHVIAFLKDHLKSYRRTYKRAPSDIRGWQRGYLTGIHRVPALCSGAMAPAASSGSRTRRVQAASHWPRFQPQNDLRPLPACAHLSRLPQDTWHER